MSIKFQAIRVVAFDRNNNPITGSPDGWTARLAGRRGILSFARWSATVEYLLARDVLCLAIDTTTQVTALGKTLGRITLSGLAGSFLLSKGGSMIGTAMADLSVRGAEKRTIVKAVLMMKDTTTVPLECPQIEFDKLRQLLPDSVTKEESAEAAAALLNLSERMVQDGERVLPEIDQKMESLEVLEADAKKEAEDGENFEVRDKARQDLLHIHNEISRQRNLRKAVDFGIRSRSGKKGVRNTGTTQSGTKSSDSKPKEWVEPLMFLITCVFGFIIGMVGALVLASVLPLKLGEDAAGSAYLIFMLGGGVAVVAYLYRRRKKRLRAVDKQSTPEKTNGNAT